MDDESVVDLDETLISPVMFRAYQAFAERVAATLVGSGVDPRSIPDEQGRIEANGSLTIFVQLPNGIEVSMSVPKEHWAWARRQ